MNAQEFDFNTRRINVTPVRDLVLSILCDTFLCKKAVPRDNDENSGIFSSERFTFVTGQYV